MTVEQRLKAILGEQAFTIAVLGFQLEEAQAKIAELEKPKPDEPAS